MEIKYNEGAYEDPELYKNTLDLIKRHNIKKIYETGTYVGWSTLILSKIDENIPVHSYELMENWHAIASERCKGRSNIFLNQINSYDGLMRDLVEHESNVLLFLDAHWARLPLRDELQAIVNKKIKPVIIVHDCYVPDKPELKYDTYEARISYDYLKQGLIDIYGGENNYRYFYSDNPPIKVGVLYVEPVI